MTTERATANQRLQTTTAFVERALIDFELRDYFEARPREERESCLQWVDAALGDRAQEERVSELLDCLAFQRPLPRI